MTGSKVAAFALAVVALLLAVVTFSIFSSGATGYVSLLGCGTGAGAVLLFLRAAALHAKPPGARARAPLRRDLGLWQRVLLVALGVFALGLGGQALLTGQSSGLGKRQATVTRAQHPSEYWQLVLLKCGAGAGMLYLGLRAGSRPPARDRRRPPRPGRDGEG